MKKRKMYKDNVMQRIVIIVFLLSAFHLHAGRINEEECRKTLYDLEARIKQVETHTIENRIEDVECVCEWHPWLEKMERIQGRFNTLNPVWRRIKDFKFQRQRRRVAKRFEVFWTEVRKSLQAESSLRELRPTIPTIEDSLELTPSNLNVRNN